MMGDAIEIEKLSLEEDLLTRHRRERKELQAKIQALKKSADKGDKKRKREVLDEIVRLEFNLDRKHSEELNQIKETKTIEVVINQDSQPLPLTKNATSTGAERISKAQRRRDKKTHAEKEKQAEILAQEEINKTGPRMLETKALKTILKSRNLMLHPIASDGDCLYNAIRYQLLVTARHPFLDTPELRSLTAEYIAANKDSLIFYMTNPANGDSLSDEEFDKYCLAVRDTPAWGGQIEIKALSNVLKAPIEVLQATGPPTIQNENNFKGPPLTITYHRFMYSLGEHYNSTRPFNVDDNNSSDEAAGPTMPDETTKW